ncbi:MAG TPA: hypothetical protein VGK48_17980 [Terriglobia bacterium]|jgi:hypothetical protein
MWYLLKVNALVAALILLAAGLVIFAIWIWTEAKALAAARYRISERVATFTNDPRFFANPLTISRRSSRNRQGVHATIDTYQ